MMFVCSVDSCTRVSASHIQKTTAIGFTKGFDAPELMQTGCQLLYKVYSDSFVFAIRCYICNGPVCVWKYGEAGHRSNWRKRQICRLVPCLWASLTATRNGCVAIPVFRSCLRLEIPRITELLCVCIWLLWVRCKRMWPQRRYRVWRVALCMSGMPCADCRTRSGGRIAETKSPRGPDLLSKVVVRRVCKLPICWYRACLHATCSDFREVPTISNGALGATEDGCSGGNDGGPRSPHLIQYHTDCVLWLRRGSRLSWIVCRKWMKSNDKCWKCRNMYAKKSWIASVLDVAKCSSTLKGALLWNAADALAPSAVGACVIVVVTTHMIMWELVSTSPQEQTYFLELKFNSNKLYVTDEFGFYVHISMSRTSIWHWKIRLC